MRLLILPLFFFALSSVGQVPLYKMVDLAPLEAIPDDLNSSRTAVIITVPNTQEDFLRIGDWEKIANQAHSAFVKMSVDAIFYVNHHDLVGSASNMANYQEIFSNRRISNLLFISQLENGFELIITKNNNGQTFIKNGQNAYFLKSETLPSALISLGKEIRRAELVQGNFLIPEKPTFLSGISVIEKTQLKNYPGQLRRSEIAVERFKKIPEIKNGNEEVIIRIQKYNSSIDAMNLELETIMKSYPYDYVMIDPMSDEDLLRNRHQYVIRSLNGSNKSVRQMLEFSVSESEKDFLSVIPIMPDRTTIKSIPHDALVTKFYVRQNITKNVHVGEWDADVTWQSALKNMIGNLTQRLKTKN